MRTLIHDWVDAARAGTNPRVAGRLDSGWVVAGERQNLPGYCLLLPDPVVDDLNDLGADGRRRFLLDMTKVGDAVMRAFQPLRLNYEILGNTEPALHAHIFPRYAWEPKLLRTKPVWFYYPWWLLRPVRDEKTVSRTVGRLRAAMAELG
jgi:diadenosine tetraphosphate (Ap4A) HIT family hydrolase